MLIKVTFFIKSWTFWKIEEADGIVDPCGSVAEGEAFYVSSNITKGL